MLGNLLMDVNKPSLWKNGAAGVGRVDRVWMVGWKRWLAGVLLQSFSLSNMRERPHTERHLG